MIKKRLKKNAKIVDQFLIRFLKSQKKTLLVKPMKYGVISGGKKIRSTIIFDTGKLYLFLARLLRCFGCFANTTFLPNFLEISSRNLLTSL